jgi:hypothetical protein
MLVHASDKYDLQRSDMSNQNEDESAIRIRLALGYERVFEDPQALNAWIATLAEEEQAIVRSWLAEATPDSHTA